MTVRRRTIFGNENLHNFDVIVVGSGAGGAAAADVLTRNGKKVLVIEAGSNYFRGLENPDPTKLKTLFSTDEIKSIRNFVTPDPVVEPRTFRKKESDGERSYVGDVNHLPKTVGGGAVHADLKVPRFMPYDFHLGSLLGSSVSGASFADWPVDYATLEPFYLYMERAMGVQGLYDLKINPFDPWRSGPYPMKPGVPMYAALRVSEGASKLGYHPYPYQAAVTSEPYDGRPPCVNCGFCVHYGCSISAKGSPAVTTLRRALLTGNCQLVTETRVIKINYSGTQITGLDAIGPRGETLSFKADAYVLAASPIETARLLFLSSPDRKNPIGNSSGLVGRNLMFHFQTVVVGIFDERLHPHRGRTVTHGMLDFRGVPGDKNRPLGGIIEFGAPPEPISEALTYATEMGLSGHRLKKFIGESPMRDRIVALLMQGEDAPQLSNRIDLDPSVKDLDGLPVPRITYQNHSFELSASEFYIPKMLEIMKAAGARIGVVAPHDSIPGSKHILGTLRFGKDPANSVCDPSGRFHDFNNLYAADGSLFPTSSGNNPTLTIATVGAYVGACMVHKNQPVRAIS